MREKNRSHKVRTVLALDLIGWKTGERFLSKALSAAIEIKSFSDVLVLLLNQPDRVI